MHARPQLQSRQATRGSAGGHRIVQRATAPSPAPAPHHALPASVGIGPPNRTGLPDRLKTGMEALSGIALDDVRVHRNSTRPAQLQAHAYAQGTDIHLAPGKEEHLPHEAWHVVQQMQGRVRPTARGAGNVPLNNDIALEGEADTMGARAARGGVRDAGAMPLAAAPALPGVAQCIPVDAGDIGKTFDVTPTSGVRQNSVLLAIPGGGWYQFSCGNVRGQDNIHARVGGAPSTSGPTGPSSAPSSSVSSSHGTSSLPSGASGYSTTHASTSATEFNIVAIARANNISVAEALLRIRNSFQVNPRTLRLHYPFGSKTIAKGGEAFDTPGETTKRPQGMVSYRAGDYGKKHKKVGKDYDEWADELSDSDEDEADKQARAEDIASFLEDDDAMEFDDLNSRQKAALGGLMSVALISDPMRTEHDSRRTERDFMEQIHARARGETTFHEMFGSKSTSTFLPARSGGSGQQRTALGKETEAVKKELQGQPELWQNNCLINAICRAAHNRNATEGELLAIRYNLDNVGEMMVASPQTVGAIRQVLNINNQILVRYPVGTPTLNETIAGIPPTLTIYHTGGYHFQHTPPHGTVYK